MLRKGEPFLLLLCHLSSCYLSYNSSDKSYSVISHECGYRDTGLWLWHTTYSCFFQLHSDGKNFFVEYTVYPEKQPTSPQSTVKHYRLYMYDQQPYEHGHYSPWNHFYRCTSSNSYNMGIKLWAVCPLWFEYERIMSGVWVFPCFPTIVRLWSANNNRGSPGLDRMVPGFTKNYAISPYHH